MPTATLTSKGQITIPSDVRARMNVHSGDKIDFVFQPDGSVRLQTKKQPFERLRGCMKVPGQKALTVRQMDEAIGRALAEKHARILREASE